MFIYSITYTIGNRELQETYNVDLYTPEEATNLMELLSTHDAVIKAKLEVINA